MKKAMAASEFETSKFGKKEFIACRTPNQQKKNSKYVHVKTLSAHKRKHQYEINLKGSL